MPANSRQARTAILVWAQLFAGALVQRSDDAAQLAKARGKTLHVSRCCGGHRREANENILGHFQQLAVLIEWLTHGIGLALRQGVPLKYSGAGLRVRALDDKRRDCQSAGRKSRRTPPPSSSPQTPQGRQA
jgi:hypothetical protein